jgi:hypothetical protein
MAGFPRFSGDVRLMTTALQSFSSQALSDGVANGFIFLFPF